MDEHKDRDGSVSNFAESSKVTVSDRVASGDSEKAIAVESVATEDQVHGQAKAEGSLKEGAAVEEGGSCNGGDIMVGVMGSVIYVDGVCIHDFGDGGGGNSSEQAAHGRSFSIDVGLEKAVKVSDGGSGAVGDLGSQGIEGSGDEELNLGSESKLGGSLVVAESKEGKLVEGEVRGGQVSDQGGGGCGTGIDVDNQKPLQEVGAVDVEAYRVGIENMVEVSAEEKAQVVDEEAVVIAKEESLEGGLVMGDANRGGVVVIKAVNSQEVGVLGNEVQDQRVENREGGSSVNETQLVVGVEKSESVEKDIEQAKETDVGGGDALEDSETQNAGGLHDEGNPGTEIPVATSSPIAEDSSVEAQVFAEDAMVVADNEALNLKLEASGSDAMQGIISNSERDSVATEKDGVSNAMSKSLDEQTQVTVEEKVASMETEEITYPNVEGMGTDAFKANFCFSVEELQAMTETSNGNTENHYNAFADSQCSYQPTQVVVEGEIAAADNNMLLNMGKGQKPQIDGCLDQSMAHDSSETQSNVEPEKGIDKQVTGAEKAGSQEDQEIIFAEQQVTVVAVNGSSEDHSNICSDSTTSGRSAQVVGDEVAQMDYKALSDPIVEASNYANLDGISSSGMDQHIQTEIVCGAMEIDAQPALVNNDKVLTSITEVAEPPGDDRQLKLLDCLDKSAACDPAQTDSSMGQLMEVQEQVTCVEQLGREENKVEEQNSEPKTACMSTETVAQMMDKRKTTIASNEEALNSKNELNEPVQGDQQLKVEEGLDESAARDLSEIDSDVGQEMTVEEHVEAEQVGSHEGQEMEVEEQDTDPEQPKTTEERSAKHAALKSGSSGKAHQDRYWLPPDDEGEFSVSDLVWGKVRSHPWWPGQIFEPSDASEKAMKYQKKDCFLVAYFGDRTFAWNEASLLKHFRSHFSQVEKQSNSEVFQNAVDCALEEVARRIELGLACSCIPKYTYDKIKFQVVENTGIRQESSTRGGVDESTSADLFEPDKLVEYMKALAQSPAVGADRLELVIAKSQLLAFYRLKGHTQLPEFQYCGGLLENADALQLGDEQIDHASPVFLEDGQSPADLELTQTERSYHQRKHNLKDSVYPRKKEKSLSELMGESWDPVDDEIGSDENSKLVLSPSGKKRKGSDAFADDSAMPEGRKTISLAKVSPSSFPKPSFKIGECIRRVASQMTGSPSMLRSNNQKLDGSGDGLVGDGPDVSFQHSGDAEIKRMIDPTEYSSLDELLSQLHLAAQDPLKGYSFSNIIISFFSDFRNSLIMEQHDKLGKRKAYLSTGGSPETFEFEDMSDTYWTDRVIQNGSEEQPSRKSRKRDNQLVPVELDKPLRRSNSRKRYSDGSYDLLAENPIGCTDEKAPAELVMHFPVVDSVPSEMNLNKMFRCFGPLKESETEVDRDTNRARVVFKRCSDAEAAYGSAPKFNIFGSTVVNYQLNYTISVPFKTMPIAASQIEEDATLFLQY